MKNKEHDPAGLAGLRKQAGNTPISISGESLMPEQVLHELRVHQMELETQNEELRRTQRELEASRLRYFDLYDLAPVGYCTISEKNQILETNLTIRSLLGETKETLSEQPITRYIFSDDQDHFYHYSKSLFTTMVKQVCEVRLVKGDGNVFWARLEGVAMPGTEGDPFYHLAISDINESKQVKEALQKNQAKLEMLFQILPVGLSIIDKDRAVVANNPALEKILDLPSHKLTDNNFEHRTYVRADGAPFKPEELPSIIVARERKPIENVEIGINKEDGAIIWTNVCAVPTPFAEWDVVITTTDITRRKQSEKELLNVKLELDHQYSQLLAIFEHVLDGIIIVGLDGRLLKWNPAALVMHGFTSEEECRMALSDFGASFELSDAQGRILPSQDWPLARILRGERLSGVEIHIRRLRADWKRIFSCQGTIVRDTSGQEIIAMVMIRDITRFKEAEEKINDIALFPEQSPSPVMRIDDKGVLRYGNPASAALQRQCGFAVGVKVTQEWFDLALASVTDHQTRFKEAVVDDKAYTFTIVPIASMGYVNIYAFDITERKRVERELARYQSNLKQLVMERTAALRSSEEQLVRANEMKLLGQLTSGVAHEVRNPLNGIMAIMGALSKEISDNSRFHPYLQHMRNQVTRLTVLMEDLLTLGRPIQTEKMVAISLVSTARRVLQSWQVSLPEKREVRFVSPREGEDRCTILADAAGMEQVVVNLLENAHQHSPAGCEIMLSIQPHPRGDLVLLTVGDHGPGIPPEIVPRIFEPFFTTRKGGTGLGLSIVRHIVESHGGTIAVVTGKENPGASFEVSLPLSTTGGG
jgi:PAS domain S-box-containing protein